MELEEAFKLELQLDWSWLRPARPAPFSPVEKAAPGAGGGLPPEDWTAGPPAPRGRAPISIARKKKGGLRGGAQSFTATSRC